MTAFGGALTDPTKILGSRVGAYIVDILISTVVIGGVFLLVDAGKFESIDGGTSAGAQQICNDINRNLQTDINGNAVVGADDPLCVPLGDTAHVATGSDYRQIQVHLWAGFIAFGVANYVLLTAVAGGTLGKLLFGLRVVKANGQRAGLGRNLLRWVLLIVDGFCCYFLPGLWVASKSKGHRRIGDMAAGTFVVHRSAEGRLLSIPGLLVVKNRQDPYVQAATAHLAAPIDPAADGIAAPVFDASRNTYVRYDQQSGAWFQWDDRTQSWIPAQQ